MDNIHVQYTAGCSNSDVNGTI